MKRYRALLLTVTKVSNLNDKCDQPHFVTKTVVDICTIWQVPGTDPRYGLVVIGKGFRFLLQSSQWRIRYYYGICCRSFHILPYFFFRTIHLRSRDRVVGLDDRGVGVWVPVGSRIFSFPHRPNRLCGSANLLSNGYRGLFPRGEATGAWI
jgi:hypothetical protein